MTGRHPVVVYRGQRVHPWCSRCSRRARVLVVGHRAKSPWRASCSFACTMHREKVIGTFAAHEPITVVALPTKICADVVKYPEGINPATCGN